jgi:diacylglycerol kinase (ATP)
MITKDNLYKPLRAKLIFNPLSGAPGESPGQLMAIVEALQALQIIPEVFLVKPGCDLTTTVKEAQRRGMGLFVVCGGDGTIDTVAAALSGSRAVLGIIPTGIQNNVALGLGIPADISGAAALLRKGNRIKVDIGVATCGKVQRPFLEVCSVGLLSALFPAADDIQHGNLARLGDFLATLVAAPPGEIHLVLDRHHEINTQGHVVIISNMPFTGPHFPVGPSGAHQDGLLDLMVFANLTKLDLLGFAVQMAGGVTDDPRIQRYTARRVEIDTRPPLAVVFRWARAGWLSSLSAGH